MKIILFFFLLPQKLASLINRIVYSVSCAKNIFNLLCTVSLSGILYILIMRKIYVNYDN